MSDEFVEFLDQLELDVVGAAVDQQLLYREMVSAGLPPSIAHLASKAVRRADGVLLYGSWARNQARASSDVDLLILNGSSFVAPTSDAKMSLSHYTQNQLRAADETLFGMHLARDGVILHDTNDALAKLLASISPPDPDALLSRIRQMCTVLDATPRDVADYVEGLCKVARYLLRSAIYAKALREGRPSFSLDDLADVMNDPTIPVVLSSHEEVHPEASPLVFEDLKHRLQAILGPLPANRFGSLDALIVGEWEGSEDLAALATLAISDDEELPYEELPKVIL